MPTSEDDPAWGDAEQRTARGTCVRVGIPSPLRIGRRWCVHLPGVTAEPGGDLLDLVIPRGAFGSGEHETTASCLEELERIDSCRGARVLDVGCGTGVLAIAALRLGAGIAVGVDISAQAVMTARRAASLNRFDGRLVIVLGTLRAVRTGQYDLILANLHGDVLLDLAAPMVAAAAPSAPIVLSGIAWEYAFPVREEFVAVGCRVVRERWLEEYVTIVLTAPGEG